MSKHLKFLLLIVVFVLMIGAYYYFGMKTKVNNVAPTNSNIAEQTNTQILARLLAPLNTQGTSIKLKDIKKDLIATNFSMLGTDAKK